MKEKCGYYEFEVYEYWPSLHLDKAQGYCYTIYKPGSEDIVRESEEWFESEMRARLAAIGHISLLENGEG